MRLEEIKQLYLDPSKHSNYQILPKRILEIIDIPQDKIFSRFERERLDFIKRNIEFKGKSILDIGGNTGYFSFEALDLGARQVCHVEGNSKHSEFVKVMASLTKSNVTTIRAYFDFKDILKNQYFDIVFNLNVVHHLGDDFGNKKISKKKALKNMAETFRYFEGRCKIMIFQMGFCWKGDRTQSLFKNGTKQEMIDFVKTAIENRWRIIDIGIAEVENGITSFHSPNKKNMVRNDELGEFRNRPIFILKA